MYEEYIDYCCDDVDKKKQTVISNIINEFFKGESYFGTNIGKFHIFSHGKRELNLSYSFILSLINDGIDPPEAIEVYDGNRYIYPEFQTLTFEPLEGGQYEIAVRMWSDNSWKGYKINEWNEKSYLIGVNTDGH